MSNVIMLKRSKVVDLEKFKRAKKIDNSRLLAKSYNKELHNIINSTFNKALMGDSENTGKVVQLKDYQ